MLKRFDLDGDHRDPARIARLVEWLQPVLDLWFRPVVRGLEHIPEGAALYVGNHSGGMLTPDTWVFGGAAYRVCGLDAVPYGLGHEVGIQLPIVHQFIMPLGAVRASRENAARLFRAGKKVLVYPGGDIDAFRPWRDRGKVIFGPRRGYLATAIANGVPIVPVVSAGGHSTFMILSDGRELAQRLRLDRLFRTKVFPITLSVPWGLTVGPPPPHLPLPRRIYVEVLPPIHFERAGEEAAEDAPYLEECHAGVHGAMQATLDRLEAERRG